MTEGTFRRLALSLSGAEEGEHQGHPDFRVGRRVFATLGYPRRGWAMVKLSPEAQAAFVGQAPDAFVPVKGAWGERGCTNVILEHAATAHVRAALALACEAAAHAGERSATSARVAAASRNKRRGSVS
ncbi:MAG TPA: MmcQ/YjbR family DNA-binding protein [Candidatus Acidoferrales bacterium]|nr:MmcQ/YjbR family DNA-binding protein [Candidatus Acidoferrales bacterium]